MEQETKKYTGFDLNNDGTVGFGESLISGLGVGFLAVLMFYGGIVYLIKKSRS